MNRTTFALAFLLVGCSSAADPTFSVDVPTADAGGDVLTPPTSTGSGGAAGTMQPPPTSGTGGGGGTGGAGGTGGTGGAGGAAAGTGGGAGTTAGTAGTGGAAGSVIDAGATPDAGLTPDALPPDGGGDGAVPTADATTVDSGHDAGTDAAVAPICPDTSKPSCKEATDSDAAIRATFTQACSPEGLRKCGGVDRSGVVDTLPMLCQMGAWRLAGSWSGSQWVALYSCSKGCGIPGKLCDP